MKKKVLTWVDFFLNNEYSISGTGLGIYRICYSSFFLLFGVPTYSWISQNPDIFFSPPRYSISTLFSGFPPFEFFFFLDLLIVVLFVFLLFGYKTKVVSISITVLLILGNSFKYSFGKIDHDIISVLVPFLMSFSGWGATLSIDSHKISSSSNNYKVSGLPITLIAIVIGFGFFSAGLPKFFSWVDFDLATQGVRNWVIRGYYFLGRDDFLLPAFAKISDPLFWELLDYSAVSFEIGFIFSVFKRKYFRGFVCLAIAFHFSNLLILNIGFTNLLIVYLLFIDWGLVTDKINIPPIKKFINIKSLVITLFFYLPLTILTITDTSILWTSISPIAYTLSFILETPTMYIQLIIFSLSLVLMTWVLKYRYLQDNICS